MKQLLFIIGLVLLSGCCDDTPTTTLVTSKDGCNLYLYSGNGCGYPVYFTNCAGGTHTRRQSGKTTIPFDVPTGVSQ